jgi:hypothetical protein
MKAWFEDRDPVPGLDIRTRIIVFYPWAKLRQGNGLTKCKCDATAALVNCKGLPVPLHGKGYDAFSKPGSKKLLIFV